MSWSWRGNVFRQGWARGRLAHLLSEEFVVHLDFLHFIETLMEPVVGLTQLLDVIAGLGQDASFTLRQRGSKCELKAISKCLN